MLGKKSCNSSLFRARVQRVLRFEIRDIDPTTRASPGNVWTMDKWTLHRMTAIFVLDECNGEIFECAHRVRCYWGTREIRFRRTEILSFGMRKLFAPLYPRLFLCAISPVRVSCQ